MQSSNVVRGSILNLWSLPLMRSVIGTAPSMVGGLPSASTALLAGAGKYAEITPAAAVVPLALRNFRRDGLTEFDLPDISRASDRRGSAFLSLS
jgi:hypothetical protein